MVETITPVVHGGSRKRWAVLLATHALGATSAAAVFGAALGGVGALLDAPWGAPGFLVVATLAGVYLLREVAGVPVPIPQLRRQVPDWWRTFFPFGPAAFLYGLGLGVGFFTYLSHGTLVVVAATALSTGDPLAGAAILAPFGLARGATAAVAIRARTPEEGGALVGRLARSASWPGWRAAHAIALSGVIGWSLAEARAADGAGETGAAAAALLAVVFGTSALSKLLRARTWRRALASYLLSPPLERAAALGVPTVELAVAGLPFLGLHRSAGLLSLGVLGVFSGAILAARARVGRRLDCGCFGAAATRDYRMLLARNFLIGVVAFVAWREGVDAFVGRSLGVPRGDDVVPALLVGLGLGFVVWVVASTVGAVRRGASR